MVTLCVMDTLASAVPPVTVTVCAVAQLAVVKVSAAGAKLALALSWLAIAGVIVTLPPGWLFRRTV